MNGRVHIALLHSLTRRLFPAGWLPLVLCLAIPQAALRADPAADFETANKAYEAGRYTDALGAYDKLLANRTVSEALLFNRGNTLVKLGQLGRAIESYRVAQQLAPGDVELRANLEIARTRARGGAPYQTERWRSWLDALSLNEWTALTMAAFWMLFLLLAFAQWRRAAAPYIRKYICAAGAAFLVTGVCLAVELGANYFTHTAIVVAGEADVRNGPFDEAPGLYKVRDGAELNIVDRKDNWVQVADSADRLGWVRLEDVLIYNPASPSWKKS
jgi:tetratricopeptide (TPR) repeat protein